MEQLISYETAKLAKEKGYKKLCDFSYDDDGVLTGNCEQAYNYVAPTQSLLQKWLREVHNIHIEISTNHKWNVKIVFLRNISGEIKSIDGEHHIWNIDTYEQALEIGLQNALKLIK